LKILIIFVKSTLHSKIMKPKRKKKIRQLALWTWSWVATLAIATFGPKFIWDNHTFLTIFAVLVNGANGILMIIANKNLFDDFDELERKIHLESLAITLGLSVVFGITHSLVDITNIMDLDAEISTVVLIIAIPYLAALTTKSRRYKGKVG